MKTGVCKYCGKEFEQPIYKNANGESRYGNLVYCSDDCMKLWEKEHYSKAVCEFCGKTFYKEKTDYKHYSRSRFCSEDCQKQYTEQNTKYYCRYCYQELDGYKKYSDRYCSDTCKKMHNSRFNRVCINCGNIFNVTRKRVSGKGYDLNQRFCCDNCENEYKNKMQTKIYCQHCGKEIKGNYNCGEKLKNKYCSEDCVKAAVKEEKEKFSKIVKCKQCGKEFVINERTSIGDLKRDNFCSELCRFNYRSEHQKAIWKSKTIEQIEREQRKREYTNIAKYGTPYTCLLVNNINCNMAISNNNLEFASIFMNDYNLDVELEYVIDTRSYDIKIGNVLIELNPSYTHSILPNHWNRLNGQDVGLNKNYHLEKTNIANQHNFRCIHVWQWDNKQKIINLIKPKQKIYARKLKLKEISKQDANIFIDKYHIQNSCYGNKVNIGLYNSEELVQVMTFGKPRYNKNYQWELLRLCSDSNYIIIGGAERLFKYFVRSYNPESIISYCDISKFNGDVYKKLGFDLLKQTQPQKIWSKAKQYITDNLLRQRGADQLIGTYDGKGTNNEEIMIREGWLPIYDCGQKVFVWQA